MPGPYRTAPKTLDRARRLRRDMTMAEKKVWAVVRHRQLEGLHFRRQVPIGPFIADFCCLAAKLIVEVDGGQHADSAHDDARTRWLEREGFVVLRLWNNEVMSNISGVRELIAATALERLAQLNR